jgi:Reverse transcriptase (RNA-dependent DNA polymerase)
MKAVHNKVIDPTTHVLHLKKAIYSLVQVARQWWNKFKEVMSGCNYYPSKANPCLFIKKVKDDEPMSFVIIYVDDGEIIGTPKAIKYVTESLGNTFKVMSMSEMDKFVVCQIIDTPDNDGV